MPNDKVEELSYTVSVNVACVFSQLLLLIPAYLLFRALQNSPQYNIPITIVKLTFSFSFYRFMTGKCLLYAD